jgi:hypothetical protein
MKRRHRGLRYSLTKHPYYKVIYPSEASFEKNVRGWWIRDEPSGFCTSPDPCEMNSCGWLQSFFCFLFFCPCAPVPCCLSGNYDGYQIPDFEVPVRQYKIYNVTPRQKQTSIPVAIPVQN